MKSENSLFKYSTTLIVVLFSQNTFAMNREDKDSIDHRPKTTSETNTVKWVGEIHDDESTHNTRHWHELKFTKKDDGKTYDISSNPDMVKLHHDTEKNYLVEIEAEKTPRFLLWGGELVVKKFKILAETSDIIPHNKHHIRSESRLR